MIGAPPSKRTGRRPAWSKSRSSVMSWTDVKRRRWPTGIGCRLVARCACGPGNFRPYPAEIKQENQSPACQTALSQPPPDRKPVRQTQGPRAHPRPLRQVRRRLHVRNRQRGHRHIPISGIRPEPSDNSPPANPARLIFAQRIPGESRSVARWLWTPTLCNGHRVVKTP